MANLYTRGGDKGQTSLVGGGRVSKSDPKVDCYGTIDEANSMLGLAYTQTDNEFIRTTVRKIQGRLFSVGAELASDSPETAAALKGNISEEDVAFLEGVVDTCTETTGRQTHFCHPRRGPRLGGTPCGPDHRPAGGAADCGAACAGSAGALHQPPVRRHLRHGAAPGGPDPDAGKGDGDGERGDGTAD